VYAGSNVATKINDKKDKGVNKDEQ